MTGRRPALTPTRTAAGGGPDQDWTPTEIDFVEAVAANTDIYRLADAYLTARRTKPGAPTATRRRCTSSI
jgi:hypothetical protein